MAEKQNLEAYWQEILKPKKYLAGLLSAYEGEALAALNLAASIIANADMVEDPIVENEFALVAWEDEVARGVHPPLRKLRECREHYRFADCMVHCRAWALEGESACRVLI